MTLIYGVKSVSAQSEHAVKLLADLVRNKYPNVSTLLEEGRYVDDEGESKATLEECFELISQADETFSMVGLEAKNGLSLENPLLTLSPKMVVVLILVD